MPISRIVDIDIFHNPEKDLRIPSIEECLYRGESLFYQEKYDEALLFSLLALSISSANLRAKYLRDRILFILGKKEVVVTFLVHFALGHLAKGTDLLLRRRELGLISPLLHIIGLSGSNPANRQMLRMFKRKMSIVESDYLYYMLFEVLPSHHHLSLDMATNAYIEYHTTNPVVSFTPSEEEYGREFLKNRLHIDPDRDWFVCIFARDSLYTKYRSRMTGMDPLTFRNFDINTMVEAVKVIIDRGGFVVRIGSCVEKGLNFEHERFIDYSLLYREDFMDIFLVAKSRFLVGSPSGICDVADVFDVPYLAINAVPLGYIPPAKKNLYIPKLVRWKETGKFLFMSEWLRLSSGENYIRLWSDSGLQQEGLEYVSNTKEDISLAVEEMLNRLDGTYIETDEERKLQNRMHQLLPDNFWTKHIKTLYVGLS